MRKFLCRSSRLKSFKKWKNVVRWISLSLYRESVWSDSANTKNNTKWMKTILHLKKSMMVHFPASYNSHQSYLGYYSYSCRSSRICLMKSVSAGVSSHITIETYYRKWCFFCAVCVLCFYEERYHFMLLIYNL